MNGAFSINSLTFDSGSSSVQNGGSLTIATTLIDATNSGYSVTLYVPIMGAANVVSNGGGILTLTGDNAYTGGTSITNNGTLIIGSATALGTGSLMLSAGSSFSLVTDSDFTVGNAITLANEGPVHVMAGSSGSLTLTGMITGLSNTTLELDTPGSDGGANYLAFTSPASTFNGGVSVQAGSNTIAVGASSSGSQGSVSQGPLGTGALTLSSGNALTATDSAGYTINNDIILSDEGTVTLLDSNMGKMLTLGGMISGSDGLEIAASTCGSANTLTFTYGGSTFTGGVTVDSGSTNLVVGASSTTSDGSIIQGPLGVGQLMLGNGNNFTTTGSGSFTIDNDINLGDDGNVTLLGGSMGTALTLNGAITGGSSLEIMAPGSGPDTVTLTNASSTFGGGLTVDDGNTTLVVGASGLGSADDIGSSPLGTGPLTLGNGTALTTPPGTSITILNQINIGTSEGPSTATVGGNGSTLTLMGPIYDYSDQGTLVINGPTDVEGSNDYSGGTTVNGTTVTVGNDSGLGYGPVTANAGSTLNFTSAEPGIYGMNLTGTTVNFTNASGSPSIESLTATAGSTLNFTSLEPSIYGMNLTGTTVNFTNVSGNPFIETLAMMGNSTINFANSSTPEILDMVSDSGSGNVINLGTGTELTIYQGSDPKFSGTITGGGSIGIIGEGSLQEFHLAGANTYTGNTTVGGQLLLIADNNSALGNGGTLILGAGSVFGVNQGITISNPISVSAGESPEIPGGFIGGYGTLTTSTPITFGAFSGVAGGRGIFAGGDTSAPNIIGTLTFGSGGSANLTFSGNSGMAFSIMDTTGTVAGTDYSTVVVSGSATFDSTISPSAPFTIEVIGVSGSATGTAANFDNTSMHSWTLLSATSLTFSSGFSAGNFSIDTSNFSNSLGLGHFYVTDGGNDLVLNFTPVPEPSTWILMAGGLSVIAGAAVRRRRA